MLELLLPGQCLVCMFRRRERFGLCPSCLETVTWMEQASCVRCGRTEHPRGKCPALPHGYSQALALARYQGAWRRVVWAIKFGRERKVAREAAVALAALADAFGLFSPGLVVPAPAASRKWQRFDGVNFLAAEIAGLFGCEFKAALLRLPGRGPQVGMDWFQRRQGLEEYVKLRGGVDLSGSDIWLVDDVYTTGATAAAAARALLLGGARQVAVVTLAN